MNEDTLLNIIKAHRKDALGPDSKELTTQRAGAFDRYHGRDRGDEQKGRSSYTSKDLKEAVDWAMPSIMKVFLQSGSLAEFTPVGPEDEPLAEQQTEYVNQVIMKDNPGFMIIYDAVKDTLLLKNGYVKHYWEEKEEVRKRKYSKVNEMEIAVIQQTFMVKGDKFEVEEQEQADDGTFSINAKITKSIQHEVLEAIPPEELRISPKCRGSIKESPFVEHLPIMTRSDLIEMGMDKEFVGKLAAKGKDGKPEQAARDSVSDETNASGINLNDPSTDEIEYGEIYLNVDYDNDGIAELRKVIVVDNQIPDGDEWNEVVDQIPIASGVVKRIPHRHIGESFDDDLEDIQQLLTTFHRQMNDNLYRTNNQEWLINRRVHLPDFAKSLPGGYKRVLDDGPVTGCAEPIQTTPILDQILPAIQHFEDVKANRTGINDFNTGLDPDVLKQSTKGAIADNSSKANQLLEMMTRMLSETLIKSLVLGVHRDLIQHQDKERVISMRGQYITVKPDSWEERTDLTLKVGLGTGTGEEKIQKLSMLSIQQDKIAERGLVGPKQSYNMFADFAEAIGMDVPEKYAMDPEGDEYKQAQEAAKNQQPPPNPLAEAEKVKGEFKLQSEQMKNQVKQMADQAKIEQEQTVEFFKAHMEQSRQEADRRSHEAIEIMKTEVKALIEGYKVDVGKQGIGAELNGQS